MGDSLSFPKQEQRYLRLAVDAYLDDRNNDAVDLFTKRDKLLIH